MCTKNIHPGQKQIPTHFQCPKEGIPWMTSDKNNQNSSLSSKCSLVLSFSVELYTDIKDFKDQT
jgi:hypothetical protein